MFDRRAFLVGSASFGAFSLLPSCGPDPAAAAADGTIENPWTALDFGPNAAEKTSAPPVIYGARVDEKRVRLWVEVADVGTAPPTPHAMQQDHFIQELYIRDEFGNEIASLSFPYEAQARLIASVELPVQVTRIVAISKCSKTGYWKTEAEVAALAVEPAGDLQRAYTAAQPGAMEDKILAHVPLLGKRPDGSFAVEVGDREQGKLHEMSEAHFIRHVVVIDDSHQVRVSQPLSFTVAEPVVENVNVAGAKKVRVLALCNQHFYWEAEYAVI
jgi:desulfoferrodoxin (superoxide reductase-like protein)